MKPKSNVIKLFLLTFSLQKSFYILSFLRAIANTGKTLIGVYGLSLIVQSLINGDQTRALQVAAIIVGVEVVVRILELVFNTYIELSKTKLSIKIKSHLIGKMMSVEYKYLEDPDYLMLSDKARLAIDNLGELNKYLTSMIEIVNSFIILCSLLTIIIVFNPVILIIIGLNVLLHAIVANLAGKKQYMLFQQLGPVNRKLAYYKESVRDVKYQKDYRIYPLGDLIYKRHDETLEDSCDYLYGFTKFLGKSQAAYMFINVLQLTSIYMYIGYTSITQGLGVSSYILLTATAIQVATALDTFAGRIIQTRRNVLLLKPMFDIMETEDAVTMNKGTLECPPLEEISFENVSFTYPGSEEEILHSVSFDIKKGEKVSIVGINGAGKTTIVKLISRFFTPTSGRILWNGVDIQDYEYHSYIEQLSAVFQDFKLFAISIRDNVELKGSNDPKIRDCLYKVGLENKLESLPHNIDSFLSKEYSKEGVELSGGERQKVAIARAMYKNSSLTILDEPTSALDPISEAEIYEQFNDLVQDKTTIYISHRMSSSVFCDKIIVLDSGEISAIDTHPNLMKQTEGMYYTLFESQSTYYR